MNRGRFLNSSKFQSPKLPRNAGCYSSGVEETRRSQRRPRWRQRRPTRRRSWRSRSSPRSIWSRNRGSSCLQRAFRRVLSPQLCHIGILRRKRTIRCWEKELQGIQHRFAVEKVSTRKLFNQSVKRRSPWPVFGQCADLSIKYGLFIPVLDLRMFMPLIKPTNTQKIDAETAARISKIKKLSRPNAT